MDFLFSDINALIRTVVVGVPAYFALILVLRISGKRTLSDMNAFDFVVTVALGSTLATVITSPDVLLAEGVLALFLLVAMQFVITWTSLRWGRVARLVKSEPAALVYRGQMMRDAMRRERFLESELQAAVRKKGLGSIADADLVVLETDGTLSVISDLSEPDGAISTVSGVPDDPRFDG